ncbi:hypothetical protein MUP59_06865 [Candidatus Bathyarchaeota archaeon]|nr:hypothetical protein [Candidatus Bathyarchaeota archaeon]
MSSGEEIIGAVMVFFLLILCCPLSCGVLYLGHRVGWNRRLGLAEVAALLILVIGVPVALKLSYFIPFLLLPLAGVFVVAYLAGRKRWVEPKGILILIGCMVLVGVISLLSTSMGGR